jgi:hypothetical protein
LYRNKTEGGNTLTISYQNQTTFSNSNQYYAAVSKSIKYSATDVNNMYNVVNLTDAYMQIPTDVRKISRAQRGVKLINQEQFLVQDEIVSTNAVEVIWNCHTFATVTINGNKATFTLNSKKMIAEILSPVSATFLTASTNPPSPAKSNTGTTNLIVKLPLVMQNSKIVVRFYPEGTTPAVPAITDLSAW